MDKKRKIILVSIAALIVLILGIALRCVTNNARAEKVYANMAGAVLYSDGEGEGTTWKYTWTIKYSFHEDGTVTQDEHWEGRFTENDKDHRQDFDKDTTEEYTYKIRIDFWGNVVAEFQNGEEEREYEIVVNSSDFPISIGGYVSPLKKFFHQT